MNKVKGVGVSKKRIKDKSKDKDKNKNLYTIAAVVVCISVVAGLVLSGGSGIDFPRARGGEMRQTLSPNYFVGKAARAYDAARKIPEVLDKVYCYCKCQENHNHKSLRTCFVDAHGSQCGICMDEALMAYDLYKKGYSTDRIVEEINGAFSKWLKKI